MKYRIALFLIFLVTAFSCSGGKKPAVPGKQEISQTRKDDIIPSKINAVKSVKYSIKKGKDEKRDFEIHIVQKDALLEGMVKEKGNEICSFNISQTETNKPIAVKIVRNEKQYDFSKIAEHDMVISKLLDFLSKQSLHDYIEKNKKGRDMVMSPSGPLNCLFIKADFISDKSKIFFSSKAPLLGIVTISDDDYLLEWAGSEANEN